MAPPPRRRASPLFDTLPNLLTYPIRFSLRNPLATAPLLFAILYYPDRVASILPPKLAAIATSEWFIRALKACLAISIMRTTSNKLSSWAVNNWKPAAKFVASQELVLITGGSRGIGEGLARDFSARGVKVVILDLSPPKDALPPNIHYYNCDVTSSSNIAETASMIRKSHGHPTVLINNAGITGGVWPILQANEAEIRKIFEVNTISHWFMVKEFVPAMVEKNHGHVVTIASMSAYVTIAGMVDYACTKNSAVAFHEGLTQELRARYKAPNVRTTLVTPSWVRTPLIAPLLESPSFKDAPLEPEEVTRPIVDQVMSGKSAHLLLPKKHNPVSGIRGWPFWMSETFRDGLGALLQEAVTADRSGWSKC